MQDFEEEEYRPAGGEDVDRQPREDDVRAEIEMHKREQRGGEHRDDNPRQHPNETTMGLI